MYKSRKDFIINSAIGFIPGVFINGFMIEFGFSLGISVGVALVGMVVIGKNVRKLWAKKSKSEPL